MSGRQPLRYRSPAYREALFSETVLRRCAPVTNQIREDSSTWFNAHRVFERSGYGAADVRTGARCMVARVRTACDGGLE